ncbi:pyridoxal phosphate-dependent aminotransferase [Flavobacterium zepuense]|uniref:cysteine-S-conjugate beta-lyase n=1 Tax=Flavobacterium zepuense TaxID=2593302 RepID=A0A552VAM1_9FLAO|nr:MalY/PatB family protein [Flavobacterium zepuense]TRW27524.1 pyridoxal phosphate-dependent aminotransferase [Flavobacterium zepuense]
MEFNFDEIVNRKNTNAFKWDALPPGDVLPMWVADMDFKTASAIIQALSDRVAHGVFGYTQTPPQFYNAITNWWQKRHGFTIQQDWIVPVMGVIPALSAIVRALTQKGDKVIIQPPVYNHFYITLANCGCEIVENNLLYNHGDYSLDLNDLENQAFNPDVKLLILSNPHNPAGRVWTREELQQVAAICLKHNVIVISDEIHSDLVLDTNTHIPFASLGEEHSQNSITLASPTKTFNLAGLQVGYLFTQNSAFIKAVNTILVMQEIEMLSPFAVEALIAAYTQGEEWLEALKTYLYDNYLYLKEFVAQNIPAVTVAPLQGTYLVWVDCSALQKTSVSLAEDLLQNNNLKVNAGTMYGAAGEGFIRINIACPRAQLKKGLMRLKAGLTLQ